MALNVKRPAARLGAGTSSVESINSPNHSTQGRLVKELSWRLWSLEYSAEEARQRYADRGQFRREACMRVVLALFRIAEART
jgi:hypothetical protein